jgi:hypothetical protein
VSAEEPTAPETYRPWTPLGVTMLITALPPALIQALLPMHDYAGMDPELEAYVSGDSLAITVIVAGVAFIPATAAALILFRSHATLRWVSLTLFAWCLFKLTYAIAFPYLWPERVWPP